MQQHAETVCEIALKTRQFYDRRQPYRIYHGSTNCTRESAKTRANTIDISSLNRVLHVDTDRQVVLVEPNVPMDKLVAATLPHGLIPPVVMEFPSITAGGGFAGTSGESSSFRHGFFDRTVNWVEIVLANGQVVKASTTENAELFYGAAASFGSLGLTTRLEIRLIPAKPYVRLEYRPISSMSQAMSEIQRYTTDTDCQYLDGIMYSCDRGVLCAGYSSDKPPESTPVQRFTRSTDPWFYMHVEEILSRGHPAEEYIALVDYLFRYDRAGFWVGKYACEYFYLPNVKAVRWALDDLFHAGAMYHAVHKSGLFRQYTIQDIAVPYDGASELIDYLDDSFGRYPIWLCPVRQTTSRPDGSQVHGLMAKHHPIGSPPGEPEMLLSLGIWGPGPGTGEEFVEFNRSVERKVHALGGQKWLYARTYYTEEEFWSIYDREYYERLRRKYHATYLPTLYEKVRVRMAGGQWMELWPLRGLYGLIHSAVQTEYLLGSRRLNVFAGDIPAWLFFLVAGLYYVVTGGGL
ncbi:FAD-binding oxidoreductase [Aspergillus ruber CBS 135680]|uniref:Delta(24)-sterol reductase n=1 Tax=Aspergillus ruber (strain CBS 135680) TaxID=1388766 RepID=A0A017S2H3_ASPRC|nr:FAD-binding domain-containing protein [Aspergillus ruber CBS 135680]EYE90844.1 FAD-binding domain-containing protein [Aspergillus ruber CBS 135680]